MHPDPSLPSFTPPENQDSRHLQASSKAPHTVLNNPKEAPHSTIFGFPPNRDTLGGTAYFIVNEGNVLVDCPAWNETNRAFLESQGGVRWLFLTHRGAIGRVREIQQTFDCEVLIQEQEAYLLPELTLIRFGQEFELTPELYAIWTPGHSPGSSCLYYRQFGGVLFTGRHLLPNPQGKLLPIRTAKTFHWRRQLQSVQRLINRFSPETLQWICPGANIGFLRGKYAVEQAYQALTQWDLEHQDEECC